MGGLLGAAPQLGLPDALALHCWHFCAGWAPERWAVYEALYPVADWHQLIDLMVEIKKAL